MREPKRRIFFMHVYIYLISLIDMHIQLLYLESTWNQHKNGLAINVESVYILHWTQQGKQMNHSHQQQVAHWQVQNGFLWSPFYISYQQFEPQHLSNQSPCNIKFRFENRRGQKWTVKNYWSHWAVFKTENRLIANCGGSINWFIFTIHFHDHQLGGQKTYISSWPESFTDCRSPREKSWNIIWCIGIFWPKTCFTTHHQVLLKSFLEVICETTF